MNFSSSNTFITVFLEHTIDVTILAFLQGLSSDVLIGRIDVTTSTNRVTFELVDNENETTLFRGMSQ